MKAWLAHPDDPLDRHLATVGSRAAAFADAFEAADWGCAAGLLHDVGKACDDFQARLDGEEGKVDHAIGGAAIAQERLGPLGRLLAYAIAGHHSGLPDGDNLDDRLERRPDFDASAVPALPRLTLPSKDLKGPRAALFLRMVFSCLTDADFLATEDVIRPETVRGCGRLDADGLLTALLGRLDRLMATADDSAVNQLRRQVLDRCLHMAARPAGVFSLAVPTGGGKTLASMAFAIETAASAPAGHRGPHRTQPLRLGPHGVP